MIVHDIREAPDRLKQEARGRFNNYRVYSYDTITLAGVRSEYVTLKVAKLILESLKKDSLLRKRLSEKEGM